MNSSRFFHSRCQAVALTASLLLSGIPAARAQHAPFAQPKGQEPYANFDIRENSAGSGTAPAPAAARAGAVKTVSKWKESSAAARAALASRVPSLQTEGNRFGTTVEIVDAGTGAGFLTDASSAPRAEVLRGFLTENGALYGLNAAEIAALTPFADYANPSGSMSWVGLKQELNGLPVFQAELMAGFASNGALAHTSSNLVPGLEGGATLSTLPTLSPAEAVVRGSAAIGHKVDAAQLTVLSTENLNRASYLAGGPYFRTTKTDLVYFPLAPGSVTLAYSMTLWDKPSAYYILVDANDGTLLWRKNITQDQSQNVTYNVYTGASPSEYNPTTALPGQGFQAPGVARVSVSLVADSLTASPLGWITDSAAGATVTTTGNNCDAGLDVDAVDGIDIGSRPTSTTRTFSFSYSPAPLGTESPKTAASRSGAVTNLFFWTNRYHDALYTLGFTEVARNFQTTNTFTINGVSTNRGGVAGDAVSAQVQDTADATGTAANFNNANFSTPADGQAGIMQMYLFNFPTPNRDGDLDAEVFLHEMTHGLSNRLHSNGSGLGTYSAAGMGEGWSDYYARCLLAKAGENVNAVYQTGGYVTYLLGGLTDNYYYGIRRFPYAVIANVGANGRPHNPLTFGDIDAGKYQLTDGAYINSPIFAAGGSNEVHNIGEVWCMMLLEMRARIINRLGFAAGNPRALQIVTDAMKLDGTNPTLIVARNSLITAANAANPGAVGAADAADIRIAFAARGCGAGASMTTSGTNGTNIVVTEGYLPDLSFGTATFTDTLGNANGAADPGEDIVLNVPLTNPLTVANSAVTAKVGNYTATYGAIAAGGTATQSIPYRVPVTAQAGSLLAVPVTVTSDAGTVTATVPVRIGLLSTVSLQNFDGVTAPALPTGWTTTTSGATTAVAWVTSTANAVDTGNSAFGKDVAGTGTTTAGNALGGDTCLVSPLMTLPSGSAQLSFKHRYLFEGTAPSAYDGAVVEIKIGGGAFTDIIAAGGSFVTGAYPNCVLNQGSTVNPISNRCGYVGSANTATTTTLINLPPSAAGQTVQFRWRVGFDNSTASTGWYVDSIAYNTFTVAPVDTDGDGLQNGYELANNLNPSDPTDAAKDSDGDGVSNLQEYLAGTDPKNPGSLLRISATTYDATAGATVAFPSVNGKAYVVEYKDDLTATSWTSLPNNTTPATYIGTGSSMIATDASAVGKPQRFYRVRVTGS